MSTELNLVDLNTDCLRKVLKCCDLLTLSHLADVCTILRDLIRTEFFPKHTNFLCNFIDHDADQKRQLKSVGPYLRKLEIGVVGFPKSSVYIPFFKCISSCIGMDIREFTLSSPTISPDLIDCFRSVFERLESLKVKCWNVNINYDFHFHLMCPNLLHLHVEGNMTLIPPAPFHRLESLNWCTKQKFLGERCTRIANIFRSNPQLKSLKICTYDIDEVIDESVEFLPNLERLIIFGSFGLIDQHVADLANFKRLSNLKLLQISRSDFNDVVKALTKCVQLKHLKIEVTAIIYRRAPVNFINPDRDILTVAAALKQLETFSISCCQLNATFVSDFVTSAPIGFKELHLHNCGVELTDVAKQLQIHRKRVRDAEPFKICVGAKDVDKFSCPLEDEDDRLFDD